MKKRITIITVMLIILSAFYFSVSALDLYMDTEDITDTLPKGFITDKTPGLSANAELVFYSIPHDKYFYFSFTGNPFHFVPTSEYDAYVLSYTLASVGGFKPFGQIMRSYDCKTNTYTDLTYSSSRPINASDTDFSSNFDSFYFGPYYCGDSQLIGYPIAVKLLSDSGVRSHVTYTYNSLEPVQIARYWCLPGGPLYLINSESLENSAPPLEIFNRYLSSFGHDTIGTPGPEPEPEKEYPVPPVIDDNTPVTDVNKSVNPVDLPQGYVFDKFPYLGNKKEIVFYSIPHNMYFYIAFDGKAYLYNGSTTGFTDDAYTIDFDSSNLKIRAYDCNNRDIFTFIDDQTFNINMSGADLMKIVPDDSAKYLNNTTYHMYNYVDERGISFWSISPRQGSASYDYIYLPSQSVNFSDTDIPITINDLAMKHIDYYRVRQSDSTTTTNIDYRDTWTKGDTLKIGEYELFGWPVYINDYDSYNSAGSVMYADADAVYRASRYDGKIWLYNGDKLTVPPVPLSILNKFIRHFGYDVFDYSPEQENLKDDIGGLRDDMQGYFDNMNGFEESGTVAIADIGSHINSMAVISNGVWSILPSWFYSILTLMCLFLVVRKILGR